MRPNSDEGLMPSIIDRLLDPESSGTEWRRGYGVEQMYQVVRRDLEDLLNTRQSHVGLSKEYVELHRSIFAYGLPDMTAFSELSSQDREGIARIIESIINIFEPRLRDVRVRLVQASEAQKSDRKIRFHVDARLCLDPAPEVAFDTVLELSTGQYNVIASGA